MGISIAAMHYTGMAATYFLPGEPAPAVWASLDGVVIQWLVVAGMLAIITIDQDGAIKNFNPAAERMFGFDRDDVIDEDVSILLPENERSRHIQYVRNSTLHEPRIVGSTRAVRGRRKDGTMTDMELSISAMKIGGRKMFVGIGRDVTARRATEEALRRATSRHDLTDLVESPNGLTGTDG